MSSSNLPPFITQHNNGGTLLSIKVQPGAKNSGLSGIHGDALKIALQAPPVDGKANAALLKFLAHLFSAPLHIFTLVRGEKSRHKVVLCQGISPEQAALVLRFEGNGRAISE
ncbi:MAG: DUF167 domain-containing protein [Sumerlaeia bacterium]